MNDLDRLDRRIREIETTSIWAYKQIKFMVELVEDGETIVDPLLDPRNYESVNKRLRDVENSVLIARRAVDVLLEERENRIHKRIGRLLDRLVRRVHWHMPRR